MPDNSQSQARMRGNILRILKEEAPDWLTLENVFSILDYQGKGLEKDDLLIQLDYLTGKGKEYVQMREVRGERSRQKIREFKLTPRGIDLYDCNNDVSDEGIIF